MLRSTLNTLPELFNLFSKNQIFLWSLDQETVPWELGNVPSLTEPVSDRVICGFMVCFDPNYSHYLMLAFASIFEGNDSHI